MPASLRSSTKKTPERVSESGGNEDNRSKKCTSMDVLLYYPNIIGYVRVLCMIAAFVNSTYNWKMCVFFYLMAFVGDVVDGYVARAAHQCSIFGGILDMVTDRVSTCGLLLIVSHLQPDYVVYFAMLIVLDISSHWFHVMSVSQQHHKSEAALQHRNPILRWYYSIYVLFGYCCVGTEIFYVLLYVLHFMPHPMLSLICYYVCLPACVLKQIVNVIQLCSAADAIAQLDADAKNT